MPGARRRAAARARNGSRHPPRPGTRVRLPGSSPSRDRSAPPARSRTRGRRRSASSARRARARRPAPRWPAVRSGTARRAVFAARPQHRQQLIPGSTQQRLDSERPSRRRWSTAERIFSNSWNSAAFSRSPTAEQRAHLRPVDLALVEVLAERHRLVEQRADGEVEERLAAHRGGRSARAEQRVAALLEPEQHARIVVADEVLSSSKPSSSRR